MKLNVGYIPYLNMVPFHQGFGPALLQEDGLEIQFKTLSPRALGLEAEAGRIDAGAMSLVDAFRLSDRFEPLNDFGVGVKHAAGSVLLFSKTPLSKLAGVCAVTDETSTSVRLLQVLAEKRYLRTQVQYGRVAPALYDGSADALLLIGDEALQARQKGVKGLPVVTDLAAEWAIWQGIPFVFARWMIRKDLPESAKHSVEVYLENSLKQTALEINKLAKSKSKACGLSAEELKQYWEGFVYRLTPEHVWSIEAFRGLTEAACLTV